MSLLTRLVLLQEDIEMNGKTKGEDYVCWVTLHPPQSIRKWSEEHKVEKDAGLQIEEECSKPAVNSRKLNDWMNEPSNPVLHCFWDMADYILSHFGPQKGLPLLIHWLGWTRMFWMGKFGHKKLETSFYRMAQRVFWCLELFVYDHECGRQTDRLAESIWRASLRCAAKKHCSLYIFICS